MILPRPHLLEVNDREHRRWTIRLASDTGYRLQISRDNQRLVLLGEPDLRYILHEHGNDHCAAQALCTRIASELVDGLPTEVKTALFASFSAWIRRNRVFLEDSDNRLPLTG